MDQKLRTSVERKSDSKRKADHISRNNQQPFKRQNLAKEYNLGSAEKKTYEGNAPSANAITLAQRNENAAGDPDSNVVTVFRGAESYIRRESRLTVISCSKVQEYKEKGCHVFLAQISATKEDDKSEGKQVYHQLDR
nr:hypothetical protein [Tanacetum cinerariifolium]